MDINTNYSTDDINYKKKLELSYKVVLNELTNPPNWESLVQRVKYTIDPDTGQLNNEIEIPLNYQDEIETKPVNHSYIFRRSHFYKQNKRLRYEMETVWNARNYYVKLIKPEYPETVWKLKLAWKYN